MKYLLPLCAALAFASPAAAQVERRGFNGHCVPVDIADDFFARVHDGALEVTDSFGPNELGFTVLLALNAKWQVLLVATPDGNVCALWSMQIPGEPA